MLKLSELIVLKDYGQTKGIILTYYLQYMVYFFFLSMINKNYYFLGHP